MIRAHYVKIWSTYNVIAFLSEEDGDTAIRHYIHTYKTADT